MCPPNNDTLWSRTLARFERKTSRALSSGMAAAYGFRFGIAVAMRHPEYAQAYSRVLCDSEVLEAEDRIADTLIEELPIEGELDVTLN